MYDYVLMQIALFTKEEIPCTVHLQDTVEREQSVQNDLTYVTTLR